MGIFIAIEGGDGSGKATQTKILTKYLKSKQELDVLEVSFPNYGTPSAYYVERYLNGVYGISANDVHPELASLAYAVDRAGSVKTIRSHLDKNNSVVVSDRSVASNFAHQGTKIVDVKERQEFYERTMATEYDVLNFPKPDVNIVLLVPSSLAQDNVDKKSIRTYTSQKRDLHESDLHHLELAKRNYEELCRLYPKEFIPISCTDESGMMYPIDTIQERIRSVVAFFI